MSEQILVTWDCIACEHREHTPYAIFKLVKMRLHCPRCGLIQPYAWHVKKYDPEPVIYTSTPKWRYNKEHASGALQITAGWGKPLGDTRPEPPLTNTEVVTAQRTKKTASSKSRRTTKPRKRSK